MKLKRQWNCFAVYLFMSDDANLLDIDARGKVGRFARNFVDISAAIG